MHIGFLPVELARWDQARPGDLLSVGFWSDARPLRGAPGLLDWRLCGKLSAWMASGKVAGTDGEQMLFPSGGRLAWKLVLVAGLGRRAEFNEKKFRAVVHRIVKTMRGLGLSRAAMAMPGRGESSGLSARRALDLVIHESEEVQPGVLKELTVIDAPAAQKEMADLLRQRGIK
ncbi:MAG TPA: M17 family peptidase N-terminal domain-containing protein [Polyangia bacterium]|nr:M17 family peptidase N-terminal domain-containing protein [Polyangia bacterium]